MFYRCVWQDLSLARVKVEEAKEELVNCAVYDSVCEIHSRTSSVKTFLPKNYVCRINKVPEFYIFP